MNKINHVILNLLIGISWIGQILAGLLNFFIFSIVFLLFISSKFRMWAFNYGGIPLSASSFLGVVANCIVAIIMIFSIFLIINYIRNIILNVKNENFFVVQNAKSIQSILKQIVVFTVFNFIDSLISSHFDMTGLLTGFSVNTFYSLVVLGLVYVIFLVFKYGIIIQDETDHFI